MAAAILSVFSAALNKDERFSSISQLFKLVFFSPVYPPHAISPLTRPPQVIIFCLSHLPIDPPTHFLPPGWYPSGCPSFSCMVCTEIVCLMLMATRCLVCHLLESLCISMTVESLKKERQRWVRGACQQMSHHSICCERTIGRHKERKIKIWQWQINLKTNWLSRAEFINAFTTPPLRLAVIKMQWSQSDVCRFRCRIHCLRWHTMLEYI